MAAERFGRAVQLAGEHGWAGEPVAAVAYAGLGTIRVWRLQLDDAEALLKQAERALRGEVEPAAGVALHQARGMLELARGNSAGRCPLSGPPNGWPGCSSRRIRARGLCVGTCCKPSCSWAKPSSPSRFWLG